jgi:hypothetical protein
MEVVHFCEVRLLQFVQLSIVLHPMVLHLDVLHLLFELFCLAFEAFGLDVLSLGFAFLLFGDCFFAGSVMIIEGI